MTHKSLGLSDALYRYLLSVSLREPAVLRQLREETVLHPLQMMQVTPDEGQFLSLLVQLMGARKTLEVGVFTGYSSLAVALALPADGQVIACDVSEEYTAIARRYWQQAGVAHKIDLRLAPALDTLDALIDEGHSSSFDLAFIDADKGNYLNYYERSLQLVRPGGLIVADNVLWSGSVIDAADQSDSTNAIRRFNKVLHQDTRITLCMVPMSDGLTLAIRR
ncbi:MAG: class I SAM-dependent methyltransferase [Kaiparowitsia implicata GSE-PSE-MK54-09C]|jgi:predicted O-methyltransferase YrrM|nr:class I SAM-dependent methyltransferase [Kaiparowitsia implicata GSE-PSE-MK54-09C]